MSKLDTTTIVECTWECSGARFDMRLAGRETKPRRGQHACPHSLRKTCLSRGLVHSSGVQRHRQRTWTCCEGPFAEVVRATGPMAKANPIRWSTKYTDDETDLVIYPARPYSPSTGRWLSRDPVEEQGGRDLYAFARNQPVSRIDPDGRADIETPTICPKCGQSVNPVNGSCGCQPPPAPQIDCSGYRNLWPSSCKTCRGDTIEDRYPKRAYVVCEAFAKKFTGTDLQGAAACVADCLIKEEAAIQKADTSCDDRNCNRLTAHVVCYAKCRFTPNPFDLPPGADVVGWQDLLPAFCRKANVITRFDR